MNNIQKGRAGESIALRYLINNRANILETNYRINSGEIDIIAKINEELVFIEVKSRTSTKFGYPAEAVDYRKIRKIVNTAKYYILKNNLNNVAIRFDVIEIYLNDKKINHIVNAF
ncbi:MAG: YraN family protein [Romboutsia sp.]|jgi:putative endonuclease|uniref:YraN family protein n=1 Tax=Romboutsia sp. TaxID=1965302 RepID=UPI00216FC4F6|nr:YraN family protein [Romboutsia sp.]MCI9062132.1 YraN family protein [Romboutsia sp.]MCI9259154.1 YraN family protein [Romboutsia sp.]